MSYKLSTALPKANTYFATYEVTFDLESVPTKSFWIDFRGVKIADYKINDAAVVEDDVTNIAVTVKVNGSQRCRRRDNP